MALQNIRLKKKEDEVKKDLISKDPSYFQDMSLGLGTKSLAITAGDVSASSSGIAIDAVFIKTCMEAIPIRYFVFYGPCL